MNPLNRLLLLTALVVLSAGQAKAELVDYSYQWSVAPGSVLPGGTGSVTLATAPDGSAMSTIGSPTPTLIPGATVTTTSAATNVPDVFSVSFNMTVMLKDTASGATGSLTFKGHISGQLTATSATLNSIFDNPLTQTLTLGSHVYTVTIDPALLALPAPGSTTPASINALVTVNNASNPIPKAPEPSSLVLGATAVVGLISRRWMKRKLPMQ